MFACGLVGQTKSPLGIIHRVCLGKVSESGTPTSPTLLLRSPDHLQNVTSVGRRLLAHVLSVSGVYREQRSRHPLDWKDNFRMVRNPTEARGPHLQISEMPTRPGELFWRALIGCVGNSEPLVALPGANLVRYLLLLNN